MRGPQADLHSSNPQARYADYLRSLSRWNRFVLLRSEAHHARIRSALAMLTLRGEGLEIGALHNPLRIPGGRTRVVYGDRLPRREAAQLYGLPEEALVDPAYLLSADDLSAIPDRRFDFLVSNHLLEHIDDPLAALDEWLRVLRPGGVLFLTVPNYRANLYDYRRSPVRIDHLREVARRRGDPAARDRHKREHWREVIRDVELQPEGSPDFETRLGQFVADDYPIHFHVYDAESVLQLLEHVQAAGRYAVTVRRRHGLTYGYDLVFVVRRTETNGPVRGRPPGLTSALSLLVAEAAARARRPRARRASLPA